MPAHLFRSLRFWLFAVSLGGLLIVFGALSLSAHRTLRDFALDSLRTTIAQTSETLNLAVAPRMILEQPDTVKAYLDELVQSDNNGIVYLAVIDDRGKILAASRDLPNPLPAANTELERQIEGEAVHVAQPILLSGNHVGELRYGLSTHLLHAANSKAFADNLKLLLVALVAALAIVSLAGLWLSRQIGALVEASRKLAAGDLSHRADESGATEFALLASNFNRMAEAVAERITVREKLRASEERLRATLAHTPNVAVQWYDRQGTVIYWNAASETLFGWKAEEVLGKSRNPLLLKAGEVIPLTRLLDRVANGETIVGPEEFRTSHRSGEARWVEATIFTIPGDTPDNPIFVCMDVDTTPRKQAQDELELHRQHLEYMVAARTSELKASQQQLLHAEAITHLGSWTLDIQNDALTWSEETYRIFGIPPDVQITLDRFIDSIHPDDRESVLTVWRAALAGQPYDIEHRIVVGDQTKWVRERAELHRDAAGKPLVARGSVLDITEIKKAELATQQALEEAQRLARLKSEFLANMSHEIRTPLNAVLGMARIGLRDSRDDATGNRFRHILSSGQHLLGVINDILDFSKLEADKLTVETRPFPLAATVEDAIGILAAQAREKGLALSVHIAPDLPGWVNGDAMRLRQVLVNLLNNAVKFTARGEVSLDVTRQDAHMLFEVRDTGIGMSGDQLARLFKPFTQADTSTTRRFGGTGLGLAISRNLVGLMGGTIAAHSESGKGSTFTVRLPLVEAAPRAAQTAMQPPAAAGQRLTGLRILAAEDVEVNRMILEDLLEHEGAQVTFAENGQQALDRLAEAGTAAFDLVLMDVQMPVMDGHEAARRIHALGDGLPVIGLTAHALAEERAECLAAGMVDHVVKPIDPELLIAAIRRWARNGTEAPSAASPVAAVPPAPTFSTAAEPATGEIDWPAFARRFGERRSLMHKLAQTALDSYAETPAKLRRIAETKDFAELAFVAHSLKSLAGNFSAVALQELALAAETAARAEDAAAFAHGGRLAAHLESMLGELAAYLTSPA